MVEFYANGATGEVPENIERRQGFSVILPSGENLTKTDEKMVGWSEDPNAKDKDIGVYACGSTYQPSKEITKLYAVWAKDTVKISFNSNDGLGEMQTIEVLAKKETKLPNNTFTKGEWTFKEWNTEARGKWNELCQWSNRNFFNGYNTICYLE